MSIKHFTYIHKHAHRLQGSGYKYYTLLRSLYGGHIAGSVQELKYEPDLAFVRGDRCDDYLELAHYNIPYILIENDCDSMRLGQRPTELEIDRMTKACGAIFNTRSVAEHYIKHKIKLPPWIVVPLKPLKSDLAFVKRDPIVEGTLVYAGNVVPWSGRSGPYGYKSLQEVFKIFNRAGWQIHAYISSTKNAPDVTFELQKYNVTVHSWLPYPQLLEELSQYDAGLHAFNHLSTSSAAHKYAMNAAPNKCWDYLAAGIPTIGFNVGPEAKSIYHGKWGVALAPFDDLDVHRLSRRLWRELPTNWTTNPMTSKLRMDNVIDNYAQDIENLIGVALL